MGQQLRLRMWLQQRLRVRQRMRLLLRHIEKRGTAPLLYDERGDRLFALSAVIMDAFPDFLGRIGAFEKFHQL